MVIGVKNLRISCLWILFPKTLVFHYEGKIQQVQAAPSRGKETGSEVMKSVQTMLPPTFRNLISG